MSGDVQPRKRKDKRRKKEGGSLGMIHDPVSAHKFKKNEFDDRKIFDIPDQGEKIHVQNEHGVGGNICVKIIFFCLLGLLVGAVGLIYIQSQGSTDVDLPTIEESRFAEYFTGWLDDSTDDHADEHNVKLDHDLDENHEEVESDEGHDKGHDEDHDDDHDDGHDEGEGDDQSPEQDVLQRLFDIIGGGGVGGGDGDDDHDHNEYEVEESFISSNKIEESEERETQEDVDDEENEEDDEDEDDKKEYNDDDDDEEEEEDQEEDEDDKVRGRKGRNEDLEEKSNDEDDDEDEDSGVDLRKDDEDEDENDDNENNKSDVDEDEEDDEDKINNDVSDKLKNDEDDDEDDEGKNENEDDNEDKDEDEDDEDEYDASQVDEDDEEKQEKNERKGQRKFEEKNEDEDDDDEEQNEEEETVDEREEEEEPESNDKEVSEEEEPEPDDKDDSEERTDDTNEKPSDDDLGYDEIEESEEDFDEAEEQESQEKFLKPEVEPKIVKTESKASESAAKVEKQEVEEEVEDEVEGGGVAVKLGVGIALIIVAHLVLVQKWKSMGNTPSDETAHEGIVETVDNKNVENLSSETEPVIFRRQTLVPENIYLNEEGDEEEEEEEEENVEEKDIEEEAEEEENEELESEEEEEIINKKIDFWKSHAKPPSNFDKPELKEKAKEKDEEYEEEEEDVEGDDEIEEEEEDEVADEEEEEIEDEEGDEVDDEEEEEQDDEENYEDDEEEKEEEVEDDKEEEDERDLKLKKPQPKEIENPPRERVTEPPTPPPRANRNTRGAQDVEEEEEDEENTVDNFEEAEERFQDSPRFEEMKDSSEVKENKVPEKKAGNEDEWDFRQDFDFAEEQFENNPMAAIKAYDKILAKKPTLMRALIGRARALDHLAEIKKSNLYLKEATNACKSIILNHGHRLQDDMYLKLAERCIDRMRFGGALTSAIDIHKALILKFPDTPKYRNTLAVTYLMLNKIGLARRVLNETLSLWPKDGFALVHYGFILKTSDNNMEEGAKKLMEGIQTGDDGVIDGMFFFHLGDALNRLGRSKEAMEWYDLGAKKGLFLSRYQRSLYNVNRLKGQPWWTKEETTYQDFFRKLEENWREIRKEGLNLLNSKGINLFKEEAENLKDTGDWRQLDLFFRGRKQANCNKAPVTCSLVSSFKPASSCTRGQIKFSVMFPKTHVWPHCGPTNCRLRSHLGLLVPNKTYIRVAEETRSWEEGKFIIFDDSFEHEVWHNGTGPRLVLIVDVWHPELTNHERQTLSPI